MSSISHNHLRFLLGTQIKQLIYEIKSLYIIIFLFKISVYFFFVLNILINMVSIVGIMVILGNKILTKIPRFFI